MAGENSQSVITATIGPWSSRDARKKDEGADVVINELAARLRERGYEADVLVGQSDFRCDLAVRLPGDASYRLGILVDTDETYQNNDLIERYLTRPSVLRAFDWRVAMVLTKDWYHNPDDVVRRLERTLNGVQVNDKSESEPVPAPVSEGPAVIMEDTVEDGEKAFVNIPERSPPSIHVSTARYFEFIGGTSRKFWEVTVEDTNVFVRFGSIGSKRQTQLKWFDSVVPAQNEANKLILEKSRKGYVERSEPSSA